MTYTVSSGTLNPTQLNSVYESKRVVKKAIFAKNIKFYCHHPETRILGPNYLPGVFCVKIRAVYLGCRREKEWSEMKRYLSRSKTGTSEVASGLRRTAEENTDGIGVKLYAAYNTCPQRYQA